MEPLEIAPTKPLPAAIPQMQRILHRVEELKRASAERIRAVLVEAEGGGPEREPGGAIGSQSGEAELARVLFEKIAQSGAAFIFGEQLREVWPATAEGEGAWRRARIHDFAGRHGWEAYIMNDGNMAMFRPVKTGASPSGSRS